MTRFSSSHQFLPPLKFFWDTFWSAVCRSWQRSEMGPARCRADLSKGELVHRCGLGGPGLSLDTLLSVKLLAIQIANDCNGLVVGK